MSEVGSDNGPHSINLQGVSGEYRDCLGFT